MTVRQWKNKLLVPLTLVALLLSALALAPQRAEALAFTCDGKTVTVDLGLGQSPTHGSDVIWGTSGNDVIHALNGSDRVCGNGGDDTIYGGYGNDRIFGGDGKDVIHGEYGADALSGQAGDDTIFGGNANDQMWGGAGNDTIRGDGGTDAAYGSSGTDRCAAETKASCELTLSAPQCDGRTASVDMTLGQTPTSGADVIFGTPGNDTINLTSGDTVCAEGGNDTIRATGSGFLIYGGEGNDDIRTTGGTSTIYGDAGDDFIRTGAGVDTIIAGPGKDTVQAGDGNDIIGGGNSHDAINGQGGDDIINGELGNDRIWGSDGNDTITGGQGTDTVSGGAGHDVISGGDGNDTLYGYGGNDTLTGGAGTDWADGHDGTNTCDAETEVNCVTVQAEWVTGEDYLRLKAISNFDFTFSWGATSGGAEVVEATITDSSGNTEFLVLDLLTYSEYTVTSFAGHALSPAEEYRIDVVAVNGAGRSSEISLFPVSILHAEWTGTTTVSRLDGSDATTYFPPQRAQAEGYPVGDPAWFTQGSIGWRGCMVAATEWEPKTGSDVVPPLGRHSTAVLACEDGTQISRLATAWGATKCTTLRHPTSAAGYFEQQPSALQGGEQEVDLDHFCRFEYTSTNTDEWGLGLPILQAGESTGLEATYRVETAAKHHFELDTEGKLTWEVALSTTTPPPV